MPIDGVIVAVSRAARHVVRKMPVAAVYLRSGLGVEGDAHFGATVQHRYDRRRDAARVNKRQVHLIGAELFTELAAAGYMLAPGELGENITTRGIDITSLPLATRLRIGGDALIELTGLRQPCVLLDRLQPGLCAATSATRDGATFLRHGAMATVLVDGEIRSGDPIEIALPPLPHHSLPLV